MDFSSLQFPSFILLIPYALFLLVFSLYSIFNLYHLFFYGVFGLGLYLIIISFFSGTVILVALSFTFLAPYEWTSMISIGNLIKLDTNFFTL